MNLFGLTSTDGDRLEGKRRGSNGFCTRRQFLGTGTTGAAALGTVATLSRSAYAREFARRIRGVRKPTHTASARQIDPLLLQLVNRATFGFDRATYDEAAILGYDDFLESQLNFELIDDSAMDARLANFPTLAMSSQEIYDLYQMNRAVPILELMQATIERAVYSKRQLHERMVEFWTDHFNIFIVKDLCAFFKTADDRDVIRQYAMSTVPELLNASGRSAAMLFYLDNYANVVGHAQENYSRELMELHTLSVTTPYTQTDVEEAARCLTGWTIAASGNPLGFGTFLFHPPFHDFESKVVLNQFIPSGGGEIDGQIVLDILANHPNTARFIAEKLCVRFLGYDPPEDIVESVKATYLATGGDIKSMLRAILRAPVVEYRATPKFKRPFHQVASLARAVGAQINDPNNTFVSMLLLMGHAPFLWERPNGYPDTLDSWASSLLPRWQMASWMFDGVLPATIDIEGLLASEGGNAPGAQAAAIDRILTGGTMSVDEVGMLQQFYDDVSPTDPLALQDTFGLAASLPGFQWY